MIMASQISAARFALEFNTISAYIALQFMERTRGEIVLFAAAAFGVWMSIWAVILVSKWLEADLAGSSPGRSGWFRAAR